VAVDDYNFRTVASAGSRGVAPDRVDFAGDGRIDIAVFRPSTVVYGAAGPSLVDPNEMLIRLEDSAE
jgi:hypothetical protein